jgi:hypothetical protein
MAGNHSHPDSPSTGAYRACVNCGKPVDPDRKRLCNHCGLPFATEAEAVRSAREPAPAEVAAANMDFGLPVRVALLGALIVVWLIPVVIPGLSGGGDLSTANILLVASQCACSGAVIWAVTPRHRHPWHGVIPGTVLIVGLLLVGVLIPILTGTIEKTLAEGETAFSTVIELPFWAGVLVVWTFPPGLIGWLVARLTATEWTRRHAT